MSRVDRSDPLFKITKARGTLINQSPFFGALALRLRLEAIDNPSIPVMATDGKTLYYNETAVKSMPQQQVMGVVAHEVLHCAFQHMYRRRHRNHTKWNKATDYVINSILLEQRFSLPEGRLFNSKYSNMSAEQVYEKLPNDPPGSGQGSGQGGWNFGASLDPTVPNPATGETQSASDIKKTSKDWEIATKQAAELAKQAGKLPGQFKELIDELLAPQVEWRQQLWRFFNQRKPGRITWNRPNRRLIAQGIYMPSKQFEPTGDIVVAIDTSGSISRNDLKMFGSELSEIHKALQPRKLWVLDIDTQIHSVKEYGPYDRIELTYYGRGGTRFEPVFEWLKREDIKADALVYLTDGYASWPKEDFTLPVLWCINNTDITPPWGETLRINPV
jgi:predicted metal-dependent peptidase